MSGTGGAETAARHALAPATAAPRPGRSAADAGRSTPAPARPLLPRPRPRGPDGVVETAEADLDALATAGSRSLLAVPGGRAGHSARQPPSPAGVAADMCEALAVHLRAHGTALLRSGAVDVLLDALEHVPALGTGSATAELRARTAAAAPVAVRTLGGFEVLRDAEPVPRTAWQSRKARLLLKMLLARRGRMTARDVHMEALWPECDASTVGNRFSVALATVRTVLDPDRRFPSDHFVVGDDDAVGLDVTHLDIDVEHFLADADAGLALWRTGRTAEAVERLCAAEAAYGGDFLEEDPYEDWAAALREQVRARYLQVAHTLVEAADEAGEPRAAVRWALRILERDPYDEPAHLALVTDLQRAGQHGEARRRYRTYAERMRDIDVEPVPLPVVPRPSRAARTGRPAV